MPGTAGASGMVAGPLAHLDAPPLAGEEGVILVAQELAPQEVLALEEGRVRGIILASGGASSLALVMARNRGLPALVGLGDLSALRHGEPAILDGDRPGVWLHPNPDRLAEAAARQNNSGPGGVVGHHGQLPAESVDGWRLEIMANLDLAQGAAYALAQGAQGVGLFRSESYIAASPGGMVDEEMLTTLYEHLLTIFAPWPVTVRLLDILEQGNSALGTRGVRAMGHPDQARQESQLRALLRAAPSGRLRLLLPMLTSSDQLREFHILLARLAGEVGGPQQQEEGPGVEVGGLIEVPAAVSRLPELVAHLDFLTIGSNDLIQFVTAADRDERRLAPLYDPLDSLVLDLCQQVVEIGHGHGLEVGLCGEWAADPLALPLLLGLGLDGLSVAPARIPGLKEELRALDHGRCRQLVRKVRLAGDSEARAKLLAAFAAGEPGEEAGSGEK
ncbi:MAG: putative PEP-binding protein [Thermodesulfobacteriota bacterium]